MIYVQKSKPHFAFETIITFSLSGVVHILYNASGVGG